MHKFLTSGLLVAIGSMPLIAQPVVTYQPPYSTNYGSPYAGAPYAGASGVYGSSYGTYRPFASSYVQGPNLVTNYSYPFSGYSTGPGLSVSPLESRFSAPLGVPWQGTTAPISPISSGVQPPYGGATSPLYGATAPQMMGSALPVVATPAGGIAAPALPLGAPPGSGMGGYAQNIPGRPNMPLSSIPLQPNRGGYGVFDEPRYFYPGLVRRSVDGWIGSDYLYDMPANIGVAVELVAPPDVTSFISQDQIKEEVELFFRNAGINPFAQAIGDRPPLPFFHVVAFVVPVNDSYVVSFAGRLFEHVTVLRLNYDLPGVWQAITWEKQEIFVASKNQVIDQIKETARLIADLFTSRIRYFNHERMDQFDSLRVINLPQPTGNTKGLHHRSGCCER